MVTPHFIKIGENIAPVPEHPCLTHRSSFLSRRNRSYPGRKGIVNVLHFGSASCHTISLQLNITTGAHIFGVHSLTLLPYFASMQMFWACIDRKTRLNKQARLTFDTRSAKTCMTHTNILHTVVCRPDTFPFHSDCHRKTPH